MERACSSCSTVGRVISAGSRRHDVSPGRDKEMSTWHLQTADTDLTLEARQGKVVLTELGSAGHDENWLVAPVSETLLSSVTQQGAETATATRLAI